MQTLPFQFEFQNIEDLKFKPIIINVFENFNYFLKFNNFEFEKVSITIGDRKNAQFRLSDVFKNNMELKNFQHKYWFNAQALIIENKQIDYLSTCFYMINCLQEYDQDNKDFLDRFNYHESYQYKFGCTEDHLVLNYFQEIALIIFGKKITLNKSNYNLSHDIDFVNSAWKQEVKTAFKKREFKSLLTIINNKIKGINTWQNIEQIIELENEQNIKSTFFWLTEFGKTPLKNIQNADYKIDDNYILNCIEMIHQSKNHLNGLHKSISSNSINKELKKLPFSISRNRFHFLKFDINSSYKDLQDSEIKEDYSLGFSKAIGFRNSYGLPFKPFNPITFQQYDFTVFPLHIMDSSLFYFMNKKTLNEMLESVENFIQKNNQSCLIGILWHNNFFEPHSYKKLLEIINKNLN